MSTNGHLIFAARQMVKRAFLPLVSWPACCALRWCGYYRRRAELARLDRVLVALYGGIGNVVLATSMLETIAQGLADSTVDVWCQPGAAAEICRRIPNVEKVLIGGRDAVSSDYDLFVANCVAPPLRASLFGLLSGASIRAGRDPTRSHLGFLFNCRGDCGPSEHEVDRNLNIVKAIGLTPSRREPFVNVSDEHRAAAREILGQCAALGGPVIGLHPGCGAAQSFKRWGRSKFAELVRRLSQDHGATAILFGGPEETALAEAVAGEHGRVVAGRLSLLETAALIEQCDMFISNDSGLMHVAAAVGTPTVGIFGPTRPEKNRPYGRGHTVVTAHMPCQPCYSAEGRIRCTGNFPCLEALSVEQVLTAAVETMTKAKPSTGPGEVALHHVRVAS